MWAVIFWLLLVAGALTFWGADPMYTPHEKDRDGGR